MSKTKAVPLEPTQKMMWAGNATGCFEGDYPLDSRREARTVYRAMLAAAPKPKVGKASAKASLDEFFRLKPFHQRKVLEAILIECQLEIKASR